METDGSFVTFPKLLNVIGTIFSGIGTVVAIAATWQELIVGFILVYCGVALISLSYKLKRKKIQGMKTGD